MVELARAVDALAATASIYMVWVWAGGAHRPGGRGEMRQFASVGWARVDKGDAREDKRAVRAEAFQTQI
jgi:hypothetical protein